jgi:POT family proton-dependent oligopeptide transporter
VPPTIVPEVAEDKAKPGEEVVTSRRSFGERFIDLFRGMVTLKENRQGSGATSWLDLFNPVPTAWFLSINALAIFALAPLFAWAWVALDRRGWQPSIPMKMTLGLLFMCASMAVMVGAAKEENQRTTLAWKGNELPAGIETNAEGQFVNAKSGERFHAGRLTLDSSKTTLTLDGVLTEHERDHLIETTAPEGFQKQVKELRKASAEIDGTKTKSVEVQLTEEPAGFDMKYAGLKKSVVQYRPETRTLVAYQPLADKETKGLLVAAGEPTFRGTIHNLFLQSTKFRVSAWWLFWSYILATLGQLCLSPVGLSMVSKLAPAKFATMLMGVWLLVSAFGNFAAGVLGEIWGTIPPTEFFLFSTAAVGGAALVLFVLARWVTATMHGVK